MTTIFTIGYEGTDIDRFVATLQAGIIMYHIQYSIDNV